MKIKVKLFATLREKRGKEVFLDLPEGVTAQKAVDQLNITEGEIAIFLINGIDSKVTDSLKDGDTISIFPPVGGG